MGLPSLRRDEKTFLARFFLIFFALYSLLYLLDWSAVSAFLASLETMLLNRLGVGAFASGSDIFMGSRVVRIVSECSGFVMVFLLLALLYSTKIDPQRRRVAGLVFTPFLLLFNVFRLLATLLAFAWWPAAFDSVHAGLWLVDSAVVMGLWYGTFREWW